MRAWFANEGCMAEALVEASAADPIAASVDRAKMAERCNMELLLEGCAERAAVVHPAIGRTGLGRGSRGRSRARTPSWSRHFLFIPRSEKRVPATTATASLRS